MPRMRAAHGDPHSAKGGAAHKGSQFWLSRRPQVDFQPQTATFENRIAIGNHASRTKAGRAGRQITQPAKHSVHVGGRPAVSPFGASSAAGRCFHSSWCLQDHGNLLESHTPQLDRVLPLDILRLYGLGRSRHDRSDTAMNENAMRRADLRIIRVIRGYFQGSEE
jgi:hypothetical protein